MPFMIVKNDITKVPCDAIVNAANPTLLGGGGVDGAIHRAAGRELLLECMKLGGCKEGQAKITKGYKLPCKYIIHTVGPIWKGGRFGEKERLESSYRESLKLAREYNCETVAFPLISGGAYGYPKSQALQIAVKTITDFIAENEMTVYLVLFDMSMFKLKDELATDIKRYIDDFYDDEYEGFDFYGSELLNCNRLDMEYRSIELSRDVVSNTVADMCIDLSLDEAVKEIDESFSQMLLRKIDEKKMTDAECYKKANIDRKLFSKIRSDVNYKPSKVTALAFAIALELPLEETKEMLMKAGYALSHSSKFDIIVEYFIIKGNYNIFEINEALFAFDQSLLGH